VGVGETFGGVGGKKKKNIVGGLRGKKKIGKDHTVIAKGEREGGRSVLRLGASKKKTVWKGGGGG